MLAALLVEPLHIILLDEAAIRQHDIAEVFCGFGANYLPAEAKFIEIRYQAAMIDMGVGEDDGVDFFWVDHDVAVGGIGLETFTLEHTAIQEDLLAMVGGDEVLAARHFLGRTDEFDFHNNPNLTPKITKKSEVAKKCHLTARLFLVVI